MRLEPRDHSVCPPECTYDGVCPDVCPDCQMLVTLPCIQNIMTWSLLGNCYLPNRDERQFVYMHQLNLADNQYKSSEGTWETEEMPL